MSPSQHAAVLTLPRSVTFNDAMACSAELKKKLLEHCKTTSASKVITIDVGAVENFDSSALAVLLQCRRDAAGKNKTIVLMNMLPQLRELTKLYGVAELLPDA